MNDSITVTIAGRPVDANALGLALKIADHCARSDVEIYCMQVGGDAKTGWIYDLDRLDPDQVDISEDREFLDDAIRYLELRGLCAFVGPKGTRHVRFTGPVS